MSDQKYVRITTPAGTARWPWLNKPDTKFKEQGEYKVDLVIEKAKAAGLAKTIKSEMDKALASFKMENPKVAKQMKLASPSYVAEADDEGNETGNVVFKLRQYASFTSKKTGETFTKTIPLFDAKGKKVDAKVGGGSTIKANIELFPWYSAKDREVGVKLRLNAVQIIDLVEYGSASASSFGFGEEEGFEGSEAGDDPFAETEAPASSSEENDDLY